VQIWGLFSFLQKKHRKNSPLNRNSL